MFFSPFVRFFIQSKRLIFTNATMHFNIWSHLRHANTIHAGAPIAVAAIADGKTIKNTKIVSFLKTKAVSPPLFTSPKRQAAW
jgi:hypothetical protein